MPAQISLLATMALVIDVSPVNYLIKKKKIHSGKVAFVLFLFSLAYLVVIIKSLSLRKLDRNYLIFKNDQVRIK